MAANSAMNRTVCRGSCAMACFVNSVENVSIASHAVGAYHWAEVEQGVCRGRPIDRRTGKKSVERARKPRGAERERKMRGAGRERERERAKRKCKTKRKMRDKNG